MDIASESSVQTSVRKPSTGDPRLAFSRMIILGLYLVPLWAGEPARAAELTLYEPDAEGYLSCSLYGSITSVDQEQLARFIALGCKTLYLSSSGGDLRAAIALGRRIRQARMSVVVQKGKHCASACAFLYAGGVVRAPYGPVMIHRPYLNKSVASFSDTQKAFKEVSGLARQYLRDVNVSESLFDRMMTIPPEKSVSLTLDEMDALGLGFNDQVFMEFLDNQRAASAGMTKHNWLAKKKETADACGALEGAMIPNEEMETRLACWRRLFPQYFAKAE